jgi:hypothetical protein
MAEEHSANIVDGVQFVEPQIKVEIFKDAFMDVVFFYQIIYLKDSLYIWVGCKPPEMHNLYASVISKFDLVPSVTRLFGNILNDVGQQLAQRLAQKTGKFCFVSCNLPEKIPQLQEYAEKKLFEVNLIIRGLGVGNPLPILKL